MNKEIANHLLTIGAVTLSPTKPFTWSSGIQSPIYCDNRLTLSYPTVRKEIAQGLAQLIRKHAPDAEVIAGTATAGIPHAMLVADELDLPMVYVRGKAKGHGKQNLIEGKLPQGSKVIVIEDLISTGGSSIAAAEAIQQAGSTVLSVVAIFSYQLNSGAEAFKEAKLEAYVLTNYDTLVNEAKKGGLISEAEQKKLAKWRENPHNEEWMSESVL